MPIASDLPVKPAVRLKEALIAQRTVEEHLAIRPDLGRADHCGQHIAHLIVEIARGEAGHRPVERYASTQQQHRNPRCRNQQHAARERPGVRRCLLHCPGHCPSQLLGAVGREAGREDFVLHARRSAQPRPGSAGSSRL